jgi:hypothetical protein
MTLLCFATAATQFCMHWARGWGCRAAVHCGADEHVRNTIAAPLILCGRASVALLGAGMGWEETNMAGVWRTWQDETLEKGGLLGLLGVQ